METRRNQHFKAISTLTGTLGSVFLHAEQIHDSDAWRGTTDACGTQTERRSNAVTRSFTPELVPGVVSIDECKNQKRREMVRGAADVGAGPQRLGQAAAPPAVPTARGALLHERLEFEDA
jgi:hypothetical protein